MVAGALAASLSDLSTCPAGSAQGRRTLAAQATSGRSRSVRATRDSSPWLAALRGSSQAYVCAHSPTQFALGTPWHAMCESAAASQQRRRHVIDALKVPIILLTTLARHSSAGSVHADSGWSTAQELKVNQDGSLHINVGMCLCTPTSTDPRFCGRVKTADANKALVLSVTLAGALTLWLDRVPGSSTSCIISEVDMCLKLWRSGTQ